jgi:hypothetical protein
MFPSSDSVQRLHVRGTLGLGNCTLTRHFTDSQTTKIKRSMIFVYVLSREQAEEYGKGELENLYRDGTIRISLIPAKVGLWSPLTARGDAILTGL